MRHIKLEQDDHSMFDLELSPVEFEFFQKHLGAFKRMWQEQGKEFWICFLLSFRSYNVDFGCIKTTNDKTGEYITILDDAFIYIQEQFIEGKPSHAKNFIQKIAVLAQYKYRMAFLDPGLYTKNPFYTKDTRDVYREMFGQPDVDMSYVKVIALAPLFFRFGGAVCICLKRWLEADTVCSEDVSYWNPPERKIKKDTLDSPDWPDCDKASQPASVNDPHFNQYMNERLNGSPKGPMFLKGWPENTDPRFTEIENPMYNKTADPNSDWRDDVDYIKYVKLLDYVQKRVVECGAAAWKRLKQKDEATKEFFKAVMDPDAPNSQSTIHNVMNNVNSAAIASSFTGRDYTEPTTESKSSKKKKSKKKKKERKDSTSSSSIDEKVKEKAGTETDKPQQPPGHLHCGHNVTIKHVSGCSCKISTRAVPPVSGSDANTKIQFCKTHDVCAGCHKPKPPRCSCSKANLTSKASISNHHMCSNSACAKNKLTNEEVVATSADDSQQKTSSNISKDKVEKSLGQDRILVATGDKTDSPVIKQNGEGVKGPENKGCNHGSVNVAIKINREKGKKNVEKVVGKNNETAKISHIVVSRSNATVTKLGEKKEIVNTTIESVSTQTVALEEFPDLDNIAEGSHELDKTNIMSTLNLVESEDHTTTIPANEQVAVSAMDSDVTSLNSLSPQRLPHGTKIFSQPSDGRKEACQERLRKKMEQKGRIIGALAKLDMAKLDENKSQNDDDGDKFIVSGIISNTETKLTITKKKTQKTRNNSEGGTEENCVTSQSKSPSQEAHVISTRKSSTDSDSSTNEKILQHQPTTGLSKTIDSTPLRSDVKKKKCEVTSSASGVCNGGTPKKNLRKKVISADLQDADTRCISSTSDSAKQKDDALVKVATALKNFTFSKDYQNEKSKSSPIHLNKHEENAYHNGTDANKTKKNLKQCANCGDTEPTAKKYKKCTKCKELNWANVRYYCGRVCQGEDWNSKHKNEHKLNLKES